MDLQRIKEMEERLNRCTAARADLDRQLGRMEELREDMIRLFAYYGSEDWYEDRERPGSSEHRRIVQQVCYNVKYNLQKE